MWTGATSLKNLKINSIFYLILRERSLILLSFDIKSFYISLSFLPCEKFNYRTCIIYVKVLIHTVLLYFKSSHHIWRKKCFLTETWLWILHFRPNKYLMFMILLLRSIRLLCCSWKFVLTVLDNFLKFYIVSKNMCFYGSFENIL